MNKCLELDMNEMPYLPPENIIRAARGGLRFLNRYAEQQDLEYLKDLLGEYAGVPREHIVTGPGADFLLREILLCFAVGRKVVTICPSFLPPVLTEGCLGVKPIHLKPIEFSLEIELLLGELNEPTLIVLDNPNNPTGRLLLDRRAVEDILDRPDTLLAIDESYFEFSGMTFANLVCNRPNIVLVRTMDKAFCLAGACIGYMLAGRRFTDAFSTFSAFMPRPSVQAATEALRNPEYMWKCVERILAERERIGRELENLGVTVYPSSTNFLLLESGIPDIARKLHDRGILVSDISDRLTPGYIRIAVGSPEENDRFLGTYRTLLCDEGVRMTKKYPKGNLEDQGERV